MKIKFRKWNCVLQSQKYQNGRTALQLIDDGDGSQIAIHREMYPEQYSHSLVGNKMRTNDGKVSGIVERVFNTRFGKLATFKGQDQKMAYPINILVTV
jgi:hypothetical protein